MVIWLIGLSGAGKTTIGRHVHEMYKNKFQNTVFIDGDEIREIFDDHQAVDSYTVNGRRKNAERITELCAWLDHQNINVVCCILSIFPKMRASNTKRFSSYFEAYIKVPMADLKRKDNKGLYNAAINGEIENVVGVQIPFPEPKAADIVIDNSNFNISPKSHAEKIFKDAIK